MALVLTVLIFSVIFYIGFHVSKWAHKSWYPKPLMPWLGVSLAGGILLTVAIGRL